jgi:hypothetical protein
MIPAQSPPMKFSVLIPLEFNRGLAVRCIRGWAEGQSYARHDYEILVAASESHAPEELEAIRGILQPCDRILQFPLAHDMALVAAAAENAEGDVLVFTESHCLPEPDFLEKADAVLRQHPEWGGFSGGSQPLTHNLLSEIEAEMYEKDITANLTRHEWLKVLDQCFIIRRSDYRISKGIEPCYGHFAEWLFAGRLHLAGIKIGYAPEVRLGHYYVGDLPELEEFTLDFTAGEMRFSSVAATDPCGALFDPVPEWTWRARWNRPMVGQLLRLLLSREKGGLHPLFVPSTFKIFLKLLTWKMQPLGWVMGCAHGRQRLQALLLRILLGVRWKRRAAHVFHSWLIGTVHLGRLQFLHNGYQRAPLQVDSLFRALSWTPQNAAGWESIGFSHLEYFQNTPFCWSETVASLLLPLKPGAWQITFHLPPIIPQEALNLPRFFCNGVPMADARLAEGGLKIILAVPRHSAQALNLAWNSVRFNAPGDSRSLGLPISKIEWRNLAEPGEDDGQTTGAYARAA